EAALGAPRPQPLGDVTVVEEVGRLHAGADAEGGETAYVVAGGELHVLDAAARTGVREGVERLGDRAVADRVHGDLETAGRRTPQQRAELGRGLVGLALLEAGHGL